MLNVFIPGCDERLADYRCAVLFWIRWFVFGCGCAISIGIGRRRGETNRTSATFYLLFGLSSLQSHEVTGLCLTFFAALSCAVLFASRCRTPGRAYVSFVTHTSHIFHWLLARFYGSRASSQRQKNTKRGRI